MTAVQPTGRLSRRCRLAVLIAACAACVLALSTVVPASATSLKQAHPVWVTKQKVKGKKIVLKVRWPKVSGAARYEVDYAISRTGKALVGAQVQASGSKKSRTFGARSSSTQKARVTGLRPGTVYCFQVRALRGSTAGLRSPAHCKKTVDRARAPRKGGDTIAVATYNVCSNCSSSALAPWSTRLPLVLDRIRDLKVGKKGRPADVVAIEEADRAVAEKNDVGALERGLRGTFTRGCKPGDGTGNPYDNNEAVFVRDATFSIVPGSAGGMRFEHLGDPQHGACWVKVRSRTTGEEYLFVGLHLDDTASADKIRGKETKALAKAAKKAAGGVPVVYAGDSNSSRSRPSDAPRLRLQKRGYDDAYDEALRYESLPYLNSAVGTTGALRSSVAWGDHIDRVFVPRGVSVAAWKVDYRRKGSRYALPLASDHNPVIVELRFRR